jgi:hypothetical protein
MIPHYISEDNAPMLVCAGASDILIGGDILYSDKNPPIGSFIISKKRTAIARFQSDGNFVVYKGFFTPTGQATGKANPIWGSSNSTNSWEIFKTNPGPYKMAFDQGLTIMDITGKVLVNVFKLNEYTPGAQLMTITDDGNLIYTINGNPVWSLFPTAAAQTTTVPGTTGTPGTQTSPATTAQAGAILNPPFDISNYLLPIGAALAGLYFFLKK